MSWLLCLIRGHRWLAGERRAPLHPEVVVVAWPKVCLRCGARRGI